MKILVRASVLTLVFAGALATAFTPNTHASSAKAAANAMAVSAAVPIPWCTPNQNCGFPAK